MKTVLLAAALPIDFALLQPKTWTPKDPTENPLSNYTDDEVQALMGTKIVAPHGLQKGALGAVALPESWDSREHFGHCIHPVRNQLHCGSCWAFGASETLSDNLCVLSEGETDVVLSPQDLVSCDGNDSGCSGGMLPFVWMYIQHKGIVSDSCMPYVAGNGTAGSCPAACVDDATEKTYSCPHGHEPSVWETQEEMKHAIMTYGAVESAFMVYADFMHYGSGVYKYSDGKLLGGHAIKVVGWGEAEEGLYWLVANSWGPTWGLDGFFKIYDHSVDPKPQFGKQGGYSCGVPSSVVV